MKITVFSKHNCNKCKSFKEKLHLLNLSYDESNIEEITKFHPNWRNDNSIDVLAAYTLYDTLPLIRIDEQFYTYATAIKHLKQSIQESLNA